MDTLQQKAEQFEEERGSQEALVIAVINVGFYLNNWDDEHIDIWEPVFPEDLQFYPHFKLAFEKELTV